MDRDQIGVLLREANKLTNHTQFVIMGSLSVLGAVAEAPDAACFKERLSAGPKPD